MKKLRTFFALLTAASIFTSCAGGETAETVGTDPVETDTTTVETEDIYTDLPTGDFGGEELVFANETESSNWAILLLDAETINGEVMNDAVYNRNRLVEDRLNIRIRCESFDNSYQFRDTVSRNVLSGDDPYDVYDLNANLSAPLILDGNFIPIGELSLDIDKPWWNKTVMDSLTYNGKTYSLAGDISIMLWEASLCFMFNRTMSDNLGLDDHYDLVREGRWTLDAANETMKMAANDVNSDGIADVGDDYGLTANLRLMSYLMIASGETITGVDEEGLPYFDGLTPRMSDVFDKIYSYFFDTNDVFISERVKFTDTSKNWHSIFIDGQALYFFEPIGSNMELRDSPFEFGFLPLPKYDEEQEDYITPIIHFAHTMHITTARGADEMLSAALENLAAESYRTVRPAYFDSIIEGKRVQDDDTIEMFDIIFENRVMNPACIYDWGKITTIINNCGQTRDPNVASAIAEALPAIKASIQETIDFYSE